MKKIALYTVFLFSLIMGGITVSILSATPAFAGPEIESGGIVIVNTGQDDGPGGEGIGGGSTGGSGSGGSGNGGSNQYLYDSYYMVCPAGRSYSENTGCGLQPVISAVCPPLADGRSPLGVTIVERMNNIEGPLGGVWYYYSYQCHYPTVSSVQPERMQEIVCYYNFNGSHYLSQDRNTIRYGGGRIGVRPTGQTAPSPSSGTFYHFPNNCNQNQNDVWYKANATDYGYYRIDASLDYRRYEQWGWPAWMNRGETWWIAGSSGSGSFSNYYTYSCSLGGNQVFEGPTTWGNLPGQGTRQFDVSSCVSTWQCTLDNSIRIGGTNQAIEVMRNGENVNTAFPRVSVTGSGFRSSDGNAPFIRDTDMTYRTNVVSGSSPFNGSDPNTAKQYFKLLRGDGKTVERFGQWLNNPNGNLSQFMRYYWASDPNKNHRIERNHAFTGQFWVKRSDWIGDPGTWRWVRDSAECPTATSNPVNVLRSVNG